MDDQRLEMYDLAEVIADFDPNTQYSVKLVFRQNDNGTGQVPSHIVSYAAGRDIAGRQRGQDDRSGAEAANPQQDARTQEIHPVRAFHGRPDTYVWFGRQGQSRKKALASAGTRKSTQDRKMGLTAHGRIWQY